MFAICGKLQNRRCRHIERNGIFFQIGFLVGEYSIVCIYDSFFSCVDRAEVIVHCHGTVRSTVLVISCTGKIQSRIRCKIKVGRCQRIPVCKRDLFQHSFGGNHRRCGCSRTVAVIVCIKCRRNLSRIDHTLFLDETALVGSIRNFIAYIILISDRGIQQHSCLNLDILCAMILYIVMNHHHAVFI